MKMWQKNARSENVEVVLAAILEADSMDKKEIIYAVMMVRRAVGCERATWLKVADKAISDHFSRLEAQNAWNAMLESKFTGAAAAAMLLTSEPTSPIDSLIVDPLG